MIRDVTTSVSPGTFWREDGEWGKGNGEWGMGNGEWGMGNGEWGMERSITHCCEAHGLDVVQFINDALKSTIAIRVQLCLTRTRWRVSTRRQSEAISYDLVDGLLAPFRR